MNGKHQQHNWSSRENNLWTWRQINWKYTIREEKKKGIKKAYGIYVITLTRANVWVIDDQEEEEIKA